MYKILKKIYDKRFSCRTFDDSFKIPVEDINKIVSAAYLWPSTYSLWAYDIVIVDNKKLIKLLSSIRWEHMFIWRASLLLFFIKKPVKSLDIPDKLKEEFLLSNETNIDLSIAGTYVDLTSTALWYNTIWMWLYEEKKCKKVLNIPNDHELLYYVAIWKNMDDKKFVKESYNTWIKDKVFISKYWNKLYVK